ncbi:MAG: hypothetical protein IPJ81_00585 [Chitinophagaceae bacterium]|nr:hypothetical protein [Chitinophagaceae bacterium]
MKWIKKIFQKKPKPILLDGKYKVVPAFELLGETYYMHEDPLNVLAGRGLSAITHLEELLMRCSAEYLNAHIEAVEKILSDPKKINIGKLYILNNNLRERVSLTIALPKHVFKLASVVFFTKDESPFMYDSAAANKRIKTWVEADGMYDFFATNAAKNIGTIFTIARQQFKELFSGARKDQSITPETSIRSIIQASIDNRYLEMLWVADNDFTKVKELEKLPLLEYYFYSTKVS